MDEMLPEPSTDQIELIDILKALADPARLRLVTAMRDGQFHSCRTEVAAMDLHKSTLSHHYKVMREAGITSTRIIGRNRETRLRTDDLQARFPGLIDSILASARVPENA